MSIAKAYARALLEAISEKTPGAAGTTKAEAAEKELVTIVEAIEANQNLWTALCSPLTTGKEKISVCAELSKAAGASVEVAQFMALLANKGRLALLHKICLAYAELRLLASGKVPGEITASEALSGADVEELSKAFGKKLGKPVVFRVSVDPSLLAGIKVQVNGVTYDGTLRSQLQKLKDRLAGGLAGAKAQATEKSNH